MEFRSAAILASATLLFVFAAGCAPKGSDPPAAASPSPPAPVASPSPAKPFGFEATVRGLNLTLTDPRGVPMARLQAKAGTVGPKKSGGDAPAGDAVGTLRDGTATLYQAGKPVATLTAETITADRAKRTVTGRGNVVVRSLTQKEATSVRADTMVWEHDTDRITGRGHVLLTRAPDARLPGERFEADTRIRRFTLFGSGEPATGTF